MNKTSNTLQDTTKIDNACGMALYNCGMDEFDMGDSAIDILENWEYVLKSHNCKVPQRQYESDFANIRTCLKKIARELPEVVFDQIRCLTDRDMNDNLYISISEMKHDHEISKAKPDIKNTQFYKGVSAMIDYLVVHEHDIINSISDSSKSSKYRKILLKDYDNSLTTLKSWKNDILPLYDMKLISIAVHVSEKYWYNLPSDVFGCLSNTFSTVGHISIPEGEMSWLKRDNYIPMYTVSQEIYGSSIILKGVFAKSDAAQPDKKNYRFEIIACKRQYVTKSNDCVDIGNMIPNDDNRFVLRFSEKVDINDLSNEIGHLYAQTAAFYQTRIDRLGKPDSLMRPNPYGKDSEPYVTLE